MRLEPLSTNVSAAPRRVPKYRHHKPSGQAVATFGGKDFYLGPWKAATSKAEYSRRLAEWYAAGCPTFATPEPCALTVVELIELYWSYVKTTYSAETRESTIKPTLRRLRVLYGPTLATQFGPLALKAFLRALTDERVTLKDGETQRLSRPYVNRALQWVRRMFKWAVGEELVPVSILTSLHAVEGLRIGRTDAPEPPPVLPVPDVTIDATLPHLSPVVADMVRVQRLTGMRPGEVCRMTAAELDMSGDVWVYRPSKHKTAHHGRARVVSIGPRAQAIIRAYLTAHRLTAPLFSPADAEAQRKAIQRANRKTPLTPSQRARDERAAAKPKRRYRTAYTTTNYGQAIRRACETAAIPCWGPNRLRHTRLTEVRHTAGLDAAQAVGGHSKVETTQIYAEKNQELARRVALATG
jgi:integrase